MGIARYHSCISFPRRLSALDSLFVYAESVLRPLNVTFLLTFDGAIEFDHLARLISNRIHLLPGFRQRLTEAPFGIAFPSLDDDPEFRLENHLHRVRLPDGIDRAQAMRRAFGERQMMLNRSRPLWRMVLFDNWPASSSAIALTIHHCLCDGDAMVQILETLLGGDSAACSCEPEQPKWNPPPMADPYARTLQAASEMWIRQTGILTDFAMEMADNFVDFAHRNRLGLQGIADVLGTGERRVAFVPWNRGPASTCRSFEEFSVDMCDIEDIHRGAGGTLNDIALCVFTEGAARYMNHHHMPASGWFRVACGVSTREDQPCVGNLLSSMVPEIPATPMDLLERLQLVRDQTQRIKFQALPQALERIGLLAELNPIAAMTWASSAGSQLEDDFGLLNMWRTGADASAISFMLTNLRGSNAAQYLCGRRCVEQIPAVPLAPNLGYGVAIYSYDQRLSFVLVADALRFADLDLMKHCIQTALEDLRNCA